MGGKEKWWEARKEREREGGRNRQTDSRIVAPSRSTSADLMREREHRQKWEAAVVEWRDLTCNLTLEKFR